MALVKKPDLKIIEEHDTILELRLIHFIWGIPNYFQWIENQNHPEFGGGG